MSSVPSARRMEPAQRRAYLLDVASRYVGEHGTDVSLDDIAREAGISPPLMRHYFRNRNGLLVELTDRAIVELEGIFLGPDGGGLGERLSLYLQWVADNQWSHWLWVAWSSDPAVANFGPTRRRLMEGAYRIPYAELDTAMRIRANGWVAAIEATTTGWLNQGQPDRDEVIDALLDIAIRLDVADAKESAHHWRKQRAANP